MNVLNGELFSSIERFIEEYERISVLDNRFKMNIFVKNFISLKYINNHNYPISISEDFHYFFTNGENKLLICAIYEELIDHFKNCISLIEALVMEVFDDYIATYKNIFSDALSTIIVFYFICFVTRIKPTISFDYEKKTYFINFFGLKFMVFEFYKNEIKSSDEKKIYNTLSLKLSHVLISINQDLNYQDLRNIVHDLFVKTYNHEENIEDIFQNLSMEQSRSAARYNKFLKQYNDMFLHLERYFEKSIR